MRSSGPSDPWTDAFLATAALVAATGVFGGLTWAAAGCASWMTGHGWGLSPIQAWRAVLHGQAPGQLYPGVSMGLALLVGAVEFTVMGGCVVVLYRSWSHAFTRTVGLASPGALAHFRGRDAVATARRLRPSLQSERTLKAADVGVGLGRMGSGPILRSSWEDVLLAICGPRSGKTTCLAVPATLEAPGPVVATSNKADLWQVTSGPRARRGKVWTFDPQKITRTEQEFIWDALAGVSSVSDARRLAGHFIQEIRTTSDRSDFWDRDAEDLLSGLLLAAALDSKPLPQVGDWLTSLSSVQPRNILAEHGFGQLAKVMTGRSQGAVETREGVYATARAAASCLSDPEIMGWVTPQPGLPSFDAADFVRSEDALYLLSKDGAGSAAPLVAAFADRIMLEAVRAAEDSPGGRLDPPMVAVLDEAANVCRITELPRLYSHLGSRGIVPLTILQSRSQGRRVWGEGGMAELFTAATVKIIGAGMDEQAFAEELSRAVGDTDVLVTTRSHGRGNGGTSRSTRRERAQPADQIRAMPKFRALLLVTGVRPALIRLVPWMRRPQLKAAVDLDPRRRG